MSDSTPPRHVYLVDGFGFIFRAFHALPPSAGPLHAAWGDGLRTARWPLILRAGRIGR